jgi:hypothetical protein
MPRTYETADLRALEDQAYEALEDIVNGLPKDSLRTVSQLLDLCQSYYKVPELLLDVEGPSAADAPEAERRQRYVSIALLAADLARAVDGPEVDWDRIDASAVALDSEARRRLMDPVRVREGFEAVAARLRLPSIIYFSQIMCIERLREVVVVQAAKQKAWVEEQVSDNRATVQPFRGVFVERAVYLDALQVPSLKQNPLVDDETCTICYRRKSAITERLVSKVNNWRQGGGGNQPKLNFIAATFGDQFANLHTIDFERASEPLVTAATQQSAAAGEPDASRRVYMTLRREAARRMDLMDRALPGNMRRGCLRALITAIPDVPAAAEDVRSGDLRRLKELLWWLEDRGRKAGACWERGERLRDVAVEFWTGVVGGDRCRDGFALFLKRCIIEASLESSAQHWYVPRCTHVTACRLGAVT